MKPGQSIPIASVPNLRDVGGWPIVDGGRVRTGLLYRSTELDHLRDDDMPIISGLGIRSVHDLRTEGERTRKADRLPPAVEFTVVDVLADSSDAAPARLIEVLGDPKAAVDMLGDGKAVKLFEHGYREIVSLPSALLGYHRLFFDLARPEHRPGLIHCTTGKDRTGWAAAALLMLLGVSDSDVMRDYMLTNDQLLPAMQPVLDRFSSAGGDAELLRPVIGVQQEYLRASLDEMRRRFGTIERYFTQGLDIDSNTQRAIRAAFVDGDAAN